MLHIAAVQISIGIRPTGPAALHDGSDDPDQTDISRARPRSRPLHRGRDRSCRTGLRAAGAQIHPRPPPGAPRALCPPPPLPPPSQHLPALQTLPPPPPPPHVHA